MHTAHVIAVDLLPFGGVEIAEAHQFHHFLLVDTFPFQVGGGDNGPFLHGLLVGVVFAPFVRPGPGPGLA